jgi:predicted metal-dependent phosphotriesterase family hydrolase
MVTRREFLKHTSTAGLVVLTPRRIVRAAETDAPTRTSIPTAPPPGIVQTVVGPLDASKLGFTLTHEHICNNPSERFGGRANAVAKAVDKLEEARDAGVDTIVDVTTFDVGRDIRFGQEIARKSGMQIVACTGQHVFAPESYRARTLEEITELFIREIAQGIDGTDIKAGVIKVAARSKALTPAEEKVFRAAARASRATGIPVQTHTNSRERGGETQADIFEAEELGPVRISLGHSNDTSDMDYLSGLAKRGYTLGMDHAFWGMAPGATLPWQRRVDCIKQLIDAGFVNQLFLSNDWVFGDVERDKVNPYGFLYTTRKTIPYLKQIGVSPQAIHAITVENPKRFFSRS